MKAPLNYPCVLIDNNTDYITEDNLHNYVFLFIKSKKEFESEIDNFVNPSVNNFHSVIIKAADLSGLKFDNRYKTYTKK